MDLREQIGNPHRHPWELSRADMTLKLLGSKSRSTRYADIGAGDLYVARRLRELTTAPVFATDVHAEPHREDGLVVCANLDEVPPASIDCALLMDVLEHVQEDVALLVGVRRILAPSGEVLITVPAHAYLWSEHDEFLGHVRRYNRARLLEAVIRAGYQPFETFHFYAIPYLARAVSVTMAKLGSRSSHAGEVGRWRRPVHHPLTRALRAALNGDFLLSRTLGSSPLSGLGLSIAMRCRIAST